MHLLLDVHSTINDAHDHDPIHFDDIESNVSINPKALAGELPEFASIRPEEKEILQILEPLR